MNDLLLKNSLAAGNFGGHCYCMIGGEKGRGISHWAKQPTFSTHSLNVIGISGVKLGRQMIVMFRFSTKHKTSVALHADLHSR